MIKTRLTFAARLCLIVIFIVGAFLQPTPAYAASIPAEINKQFTPLQIPAGGVSVLRVTVFNPNTFPLTNASWTDDLDGVQPGLFIANPANVVNTCGSVGDVTAVPGTTTLSLANGTVPAQVGATPGQCYVEINVSSVTPGNLINTILANNLSSQGNDGGTPVSITNLTPASATITVIAVSPPALSKGFTPNTIYVGETSVLTIRLNNNDANYNLTGATYTDTLPTGLVVASPNGLTLTNCGPGTGAATPGGTTISLSGATVTPALDCIVSVNVTNATGSHGAYTNTIPAGPGGPGSLQTDQGVTNNSPASAPLNVQPVAIAKSFSPSTIDAGDVSNLTITFYNPTGSPYTGVAITDSLPANLTIDAAPITNTCGFTVNHIVGDTQIDVSGGTIPASLMPPTPNTCVLTIPVRASVASSGSRTNTIPANTLTAGQPVTNYLPATANLTIQQALYGTKAYSPTFINTGGTSQVTITLHNRASIPLTGVTFTDTLPASLTVSGTPAAAQCSGTVTSTVNSVTLTGGTIPANGNCTIVFNVTSVTPGVYDNAVAANTIVTNQGVGHAVFSTNPDLTVIDPSNLPPVRIVKTFDTNPISPGQHSRLRIQIYAPVDTSISAIDITDTLPTGLIIASPPAPAPSESCPGGTLTAVAGSDTIHYSNTTANVLAAGASCSVYVSVTSMTPGLYTNTIPANAITTNEGRTNTDPTTANIRVTSLNVSKAFYPTRVQAGGRSVMTITLENTTDSMLTNVSLLDTLPGSMNNGIRVAAPSNASTTCGVGTVTATPGSNQVILSNGTVPAQVGNVPGVCTITVDVVGNDNSPNSPSQHTNNIPVANVSATVADTGVTIQPKTSASAILYIENMSIGIVKGFNPVLVYGGASSVMSVQLINPNANTALTGIAFTDNMDPGMHLTDPVVFNTGTCGGALSGNPGDSAFSFSGGVLPPNSTCTLTVRVVMSVNANRTNTIPAGAVTTFNGVTNPDPTAASLTNLPGVSVTKGFNPSSVSINQPSTLTITIKNTSTIPVVNMGLTDGLPGTLPDGLEVANPASATNTCGGTLTANPGDQNITLSGGGLAGVGNPGDTCVITVQVLSTRPGSYLNIIPGGAITSDGGITNNDPTNDTLDVVAYYSLGNRVWFDTNNNSLLDGTEVGADGVTVQLYAADGSGNPTGAVLASQVTANGGYYRFDNLPEGDYVVVIPANQFSGGPLDGYWSSGTTLDGTGTVLESAAPAPNGDVDSDDNGTRQTSGSFSGAVISGPVTLGPSASEPTGETDADPTNPAGEAPDAFSNRTVDFGFYRQTLGDQVFVDANNNGTYDGTDTALPGATVQLFAADGVTEIPVGPDGVFGTADDANGGVTTGAGGTYLFSGLPQGNYIVRVTPPAGYISTVDTADSVDTGNPNTNTDDNDNGVGTASGAASSAVVTLTPGSTGAQNNNTVTNASGATANPTVDFGFITPIYSLGNRVWFDTNNNSLLDGTEVGADGVTVELYAADGSGNPTGSVLSSQVTANGGYYRFDNLPEGDYVVVIPANQFSGGALTGYWSSGTTLDGTGTVLEPAAPAPNGDVDSDDNGTRQTSGAFNGAVISGPVTLGPSASEPTGETDADPTNPAGEAPDAFSNRTVDFGFYRQTLGDQVFVDANNNGTYDGTDTALSGATVQLFAADGVTEIPVGPDGVFGTADDANGGVTTGAGGTYSFSGLPQGNYIVRVTPPAGYISTVDSADSVDTGNPNTNTDDNDNGVGTASGAASSAVVTLTPGSAGAQNNNTVTNASGATANPTVDFGFIATSLSITKDDGLTTVVPGSVITYTIIVTNNGTDRPSLTIVDDLPPEVTYQNASPVPTTVTPTTLTWAGISLNSGDSMTITVEVVVNSAAVGPIDNKATVTDDIIPTLTDDDNDIDTVATNNAKSITGATIDPTDPAAPAPPVLPRVLIGEIVTYQITLDVPANANMLNLTATDILDSGLAFVRCVSVNGGTLATNLPGGFTDACNDPTNPTVTAEPIGNTDPVNQGRRVTFNFGDISNPTASAQQLVVNYEVVVLDIAANVNGVGGLNNSVLWRWNGGSLAAAAPPLEIIEPDMSVGKDASPRILPLGFPVTFTIDVAHTAQSAVDAYDVTLTDVLPSNFAFLPGTIQTTGLAPTSTNYAPGTRTLTFFWDVFPLGQNASISFQATFVGPAPATNDTNLAWTSLPIDPQPNGQPQSLTPYNGFGNERWYDPLDATSVNNYGASASVTVDVPNALPATGFAPNQVTNLPEQPAAKAYADLGNTWLEIPALGLNLPTTGVPLTADGWDLTWLSNQVGYLAGTTFPGQVGTTALTGHVTLADGTAGPFRNLNRLYWGNQVVMHINGYRYVYEVRETRSVRPTDFSVFKNDGYTWLTLITCEDYNPRLDAYAYRYAVRAVLLRVEQDSAAPAPLRESGR
ncbi:MAG: sortase [Anaerolineales bacterium]|nr:sortase [Anaerolineales bacterium]